jgi:TetR/AcrR family transcriptional regulator
MTESEIKALHDPGVRERLLDAAIALFARKGYAATSVREIVEAAGVTKPVLYYHFHSKEGIFQALANLAVTAHDEVIAQVRRTPGTPTQKIILLCDLVFALVQENRDVVRVLDSVYYGPTEGSPPFDFTRLHDVFADALTAFVTAAVQAGELRDEDIESMTLALLGGFLIAKICATSPPECESMDLAGMRRITSMILDGLRAPASEQGEKS